MGGEGGEKEGAGVIRKAEMGEGDRNEKERLKGGEERRGEGREGGKGETEKAERGGGDGGGTERKGGSRKLREAGGRRRLDSLRLAYSSPDPCSSSLPLHPSPPLSHYPPPPLSLLLPLSIPLPLPSAPLPSPSRGERLQRPLLCRC